MAESLAISEPGGMGFATVMARKDVDAAALGAALGITAPTGPAAASANDLTLVGTGPGMWLAVANDAAPDWAERLAERLAGLASVSDQSGGYALFRFAGAEARTLLQRGLAIDLHPCAFGPGSAATSMIAHIGVIVWQANDLPSFNVALFRSYSASFRHWIDGAVAAL